MAARAALGPRALRAAALALALACAAVCLAAPSTALAASGRISAEVAVKGPSDQEWSHATDTFLGQEAAYRVSTRVPNIVSEYGKCGLRLETMMEGIAEPEAGSAKVTVDGVDVTDRMEWGDLGGLVVGQPSVMVEMWDVLACDWAGGGSEVAVEFKARNSGEADAGGRIRGKCGAMASYTTVEGGASGWSNASPAYNHTYTAVIRAVDASTGEALAGGSFTVRVSSYGDDPALVGKYLDGEGGLSDEPVEIACDGSGEARVPGLDGAAYAIAQAAAAPGHGAARTMTLGLSPAHDASDGSISSLGASLAGGPGARVESADAATGTVVVLAPAEAGLALPVTGAPGRPGAHALAACLALAAAALLAAAAPRGARGGDGARA